MSSIIHRKNNIKINISCIEGVKITHRGCVWLRFVIKFEFDFNKRVFFINVSWNYGFKLIIVIDTDLFLFKEFSKINENLISFC